MKRQKRLAVMEDAPIKSRKEEEFVADMPCIRDKVKKTYTMKNVPIMLRTEGYVSDFRQVPKLMPQRRTYQSVQKEDLP